MYALNFYALDNIFKHKCIVCFLFDFLFDVFCFDVYYKSTYNI